MISHLRKNKSILVGGGSQKGQAVCYIYDIIIFPVEFSTGIFRNFPQCIAKSSNAKSSIGPDRTVPIKKLSLLI